MFYVDLKTVILKMFTPGITFLKPRFASFPEDTCNMQKQIISSVRLLDVSSANLQSEKCFRFLEALNSELPGLALTELQTITFTENQG